MEPEKELVQEELWNISTLHSSGYVVAIVSTLTESCPFPVFVSLKVNFSVRSDAWVSVEGYEVIVVAPTISTLAP